MQMFASWQLLPNTTMTIFPSRKLWETNLKHNQQQRSIDSSQKERKYAKPVLASASPSAAVWTSFRDENLISAFRRYSWVSSVSLTFSLALLQFMTWDRPVLWPMLPHSARNHTISLKPTTPSPKSSTEAHTFRKTKTQTTRHPKHSLTVKPWGEVSGSSKKGLISCRRVFGGHLPILQTLWVTLRGTSLSHGSARVGRQHVHIFRNSDWVWRPGRCNGHFKTYNLRDCCVCAWKQV